MAEAIEVGSAYARFMLNLEGFAENVTTAKEGLEALRQLAGDYTVQIRASFDSYSFDSVRRQVYSSIDALQAEIESSGAGIVIPVRMGEAPSSGNYGGGGDYGNSGGGSNYYSAPEEDYAARRREQQAESERQDRLYEQRLRQEERQRQYDLEEQQRNVAPTPKRRLRTNPDGSIVDRDTGEMLRGPEVSPLDYGSSIQQSYSHGITAGGAPNGGSGPWNMASPIVPFTFPPSLTSAQAAVDAAKSEVAAITARTTSTAADTLALSEADAKLLAAEALLTQEIEAFAVAHRLKAQATATEGVQPATGTAGGTPAATVVGASTSATTTGGVPVLPDIAAVAAAKAETEALGLATGSSTKFASATAAVQDKLIQTLISAKEYAAAINLINVAQSSSATTVERQVDLTAKLTSVQQQYSTQLTELAHLQAQNAVDAGNFDTALTILETRLGLLTSGSTEYLALQHEISGVTDKATASVYKENDALLRQAQLRGDTAGIIRQTLINQVEVAPGDTARSNVVTKQDAALRAQAEGAINAEQAALLKAALAAHAYDDALAVLDVRLKDVNLSTSEQIAILSERHRIIELQIADDTAGAIASAKQAAAQGEFAAALALLAQRETEAAGIGADVLALQNAQIAVTKQQTAHTYELLDSQTQLALAQRNLRGPGGAVESNLAAQAQIVDPASAAGKERLAQLQTEEAAIALRVADADDRLTNSVLKLSQAQHNLAQKAAEVRDALGLVQEGTSVYNNLTVQQIKIEQELEATTYKLELANIAEAKAQGQRTLAIDLTNAAIQRQLALPGYLGGGAGGVAPGGSGRVDAGGVPIPPVPQVPLGANTTNIAALQTQLAVVQAMPTAWSQVSAAALRYVGPLAAVTAGYTALMYVKNQFTEGTALVAALDQEQRGLEALFGNVERGTEVFKDAIAFGQKYGETQKDIGDAAARAGIILQTTTVSTQSAFEVLERLRSRAPQQNFSAAVRSITELQAGQLQSIERVFQVPRALAQEMSKEVQSGIDPLVALDKVLNQLGQTNDVLAVRTTGLQHALNDLHLSAEKITLAFGHITTSIGPALIEGLTLVNKLIAGSLEGYARLGQDVNTLIHPRGGPLDYLHDIILGAPASASTAAGGTISDVQELTRQATAASPVLDAFFNKLKLPSAATLELGNFNDQVNALISQFTEGTASADQFYKRIHDARIANNDTSTDTALGQRGVALIQKDGGDPQQQIIELTALEHAFAQAMGSATSTQLKDSLGADVEYVAAQIKYIQDHSPIVLTVQMRMEEESFQTQYINALASAAKTANTALTNLEDTRRKQIETNTREVGATLATGGITTIPPGAILDLNNLGSMGKKEQLAEEKTLRDQARQDKKADDDFDFAQQRSIDDRNFARQKSIADFNRSEARSLADFQRGQRQQLADMNHQFDLQDEDRAFQKQRTARDRLQQDTKNERNFHEELQKMRRDYDRQTLQNTEDYNDQRAGLLAQGRVAEATVLQYQFSRSQARAGQAYGTQVSDRTDTFNQTKQDTAQQRAQQDNDAEIDAGRARARTIAENARAQQLARDNYKIQDGYRVEDFNRQLHEADDAFNKQYARAIIDYSRARRAANADRAQQLLDQQASFREQLQAVLARLAQEKADYTTKKGEINAAFKTVYDEQQAILKAHTAEVLRIEELKRAGVDEKEAKTIATLEGARDKLKIILGDIKDSFVKTTVLDEVDRINSEIAQLTGLATPQDRKGVAGGKAGSSASQNGFAGKLDDTTTSNGAIVNPASAAVVVGTDGTNGSPLTVSPSSIGIGPGPLGAIPTQIATAIIGAVAGFFKDKAQGTAAQVDQHLAATKSTIDTFHNQTGTSTDAYNTHNAASTAASTTAQTTAVQQFTGTASKAIVDYHTGVVHDTSTALGVVAGTENTYYTNSVAAQTKADLAKTTSITTSLGAQQAATTTHIATVGSEWDQFWTGNEKTLTDTLGREATALQQFLATWGAAITNLQTGGRGVLPTPSGQRQTITGVAGATGGIINDNIIGNDPRPSQSAVSALFGAGATIGDTFDAPRPGTTGTHQGIDIIMQPGTPVRAPATLVITKAGAGSQGFQGGVVIGVDPATGNEWYFGHLHGIAVAEGTTVPRGTILGYVGAEDHTHVQVRNHPGGSVIDPANAIQNAAAGGSTAGTGGLPNFNDVVGGALSNGASAGYTAQRLGGAGGASNPTDVFATRAQLGDAGANVIFVNVERSPVNINVELPPITLDGQVIGAVASRQVFNDIIGDFTVAVSINEASNKLPLQQPTFRSIR